MGAYSWLKIVMVSGIDERLAYFPAFFQYDNTDVLSLLAFQLLDTNSSAETGGSSANYTNIRFVLNSLNGFRIVKLFIRFISTRRRRVNSSTL